MKTCPKCGELLGDNVKSCFKCQYNFAMGRVLTQQERSEHAKEIDEFHKKQLERQERNQNLPFISSTTENIEGCRIVAYMGLVNGEVIMGTGFLSELGARMADSIGEESRAFDYKLREAKSRAITKMENQAKEMYANTIVGIKFSIAVIGSNMIMVSVMGTAVVRNEMEAGS